jgi:formylglycine-generating enzyme required for sulfatase activity
LDLATTSLIPGDVITCIVDVADSNGGSASDSANITVDNRAPSDPTVTISWTANGADPITTDDLTCTATSSVDPDGDAVSYTFTWTSSVGGSATGSVILAANTAVSETWICTVTTTDGTLTSNAINDSTTIVNECGLTDCDTNLDLGGGQSIDMVLIPSGSDPLGRYDISNDFYLMTTEVTQGMFTALMSYDPTTYSTTYGVGNNYPAYYVSWHMAADFANAVTQRHNSVNGTSLQECYSCSNSGSASVTCTEAVTPYQCSGYLFPTESEWEYAARKGTQYDFWTPDGGGNYSANTCNGTETIQDGVSNPLLTDYAWYCGNASSSNEVGQKLPNGFGLYDMHGNLWEWTADWWGCSYPQSSTDPYCSTQGSNSVIRGGPWNNYPDTMRASYRSTDGSSDRKNDIGFRLAHHPITQPSAPSITISNQAPTEQIDDLYCEILVDSIDPDGNSVTYTFDWTVDGLTYNGTPTTTAYSGDTIPASETIAAEVWECTVTPNDGSEDGFTSSDSVEINSECLQIGDCTISVLVVDGYGSTALASNLSSWGFSYTIEQGSNITSNYDISSYDVIAFMYNSTLSDQQYILTENVAGNIGIVIHRADNLVSDLDMGSHGFYQEGTFSISDNTHYITNVFSLGALNLNFTYKSELHNSFNNIRILGSVNGPSLVTHLYNRTVVTPYYGHSSGGIGNANSKLLTWRAYMWAAGEGTQ